MRLALLYLLAVLPTIAGLREETSRSHKDFLVLNSTKDVEKPAGKHSALLGIGTLDTESCQTQLKPLFCCSLTGGKCKDAPKRSPCDKSLGMACDWTYRGRKCVCKSNHCYDAATKSCVKKTDLSVSVGPQKRRSKALVKVEDFMTKIGSGVLDTGEAVGSGILNVAGGGLGLVSSPFTEMGRRGAMYFAGSFAGSKLNADINTVEEWLQYIMSSFVLYNDDPKKSCNLKTGVLGMGDTVPDYGHCYLPLAYEDGSPLWEGPIFPYSDGRGNDFNISLMVKAGQIRGLEALQVQSSRCFGNIVSKGGLCKLELSPSKRGVTVTDLEVEIFCEGKCSVQEQIAGILSSDDALEIGKHVYIYKPESGESNKYGTKAKACKAAKMKIVKNVIRCDHQGNKCLRHTLRDASTGKAGGDWNKENLLTEKQCESTGKAFGRFLASKLQNVWGSGGASSRKTLLYRKFNAKLVDVKVRADVYIFRTRSLMEVVNEEEGSDEEKGKLARSLNSLFGGISKTLDVIKHPWSATKNQTEMIMKYKFNLQPKRDPTGKELGYELVSCSNFVWNEDTQDYDLPPLKKCQKIRISALELLATRSDYLEVEEISSSQKSDSALTGQSPGVVLSIVAKLARMMFVRNAVSIQAPDPEGGSVKYCKDMWAKGKTPEKSYPVGVLCSAEKLLDQDPDEVGEGVDARFEFEIMELKPIWDPDRKTNMQYVGLRGGYNLEFCRVLKEKDPKSALPPGALVCDLNVTFDAGTRQVEGGVLPEEARFMLQQEGKNDLKSTISIGGTQSGEGRANCENCEEKSEESAQQQVKEELEDNDGIQENLQIRLVAALNFKYCTVKTMKFKTWFGKWSKSKKLMMCDLDVVLGKDKRSLADFPETLLTLRGNTDGLIPSQYWSFVIVLSLSCLGASAGFTGGKWAALLGGVGSVAMFTTVVGGAVGGAVGGYFLTDYLSSNYHLDGIMLRYLLHMKMEALGQQILFAVEWALDFELPRP